MAGISGSAANFVKGANYISIGNPANLNFGTGSFTYSLWVYVPASIGAYDMPLWKGGGSASSRGFDMELGTGNWAANIADGSKSLQVVFCTQKTSQWVLLTAVVDRSAGLFKGYKNGVLVASVSLGSFGSVSSTNPLYIGGLSGYRFNGTIDDVRIYNVALSSSDVAALYSSATSSTPAVSVSMTPASASMLMGGSQQFTATVSGTTNTGVTWSATGGTVSSSGLFTAPGVAGSYMVKATSVADTTKSASATVTVAAIAVSVSPSSAALFTGSTHQFLATVTGTTNTAVSWSTTGGSITSLGYYTAPTAAGTYTVTATSAADATKSASSTVTVSAPVVSVTISPGSTSINTSATQQFTASVGGTSNTAVTWSATGGTISSSGVYTAPTVAGTYSVKATSAADTTKSATAAVTVTSGHNWYVAPTGTDYSSCGTPLNPCATITYVDQNKVAAGDTVHVTGSFTLTSNTCISTAHSGTATAPITYLADPAGSAIINGNAACFYNWHNTGNYLKIYGFDFTGVQTNTSTDSGTAVLLSEGGAGNVEVAYNTVHDLASGFAAAIIMEPYGSSGYTGAPCSVHDNILHDLGYNSGLQHGNYAVYIACGTNSYVYNNLIYNEGSIGIHLWHSANNVHIWNNTIANAQYIGIIVGSGDGGAVSGAYFDVANNIVVNSNYGIMAESSSPGSISSTSVFHNNLIYNNAVNWYYNNNGTGTTLQAAGMSVTGTVTANPLFVSPSTGNYRLGAGSPALGMGIYVGITHDLDGNPVSSTAVNIGSY